MKSSPRPIAIIIALAAFLGLPLMIYALGDAPRRSLLKESLSVLTLLSFGLVLGQFFLARSNGVVLTFLAAPTVQKIHKWLSYGAISVLALHPFFIVLPRYFEGGLRPWDAFWIMLTTFDNLGVILGLAAWVLILTIGVTAYFRVKLMNRFANRYRGWRYFHGGLATAFTILSTWHAIELGRHTDTAMGTFYVLLAALGIGMLARLYWSSIPRKTVRKTLREGAY